MKNNILFVFLLIINIFYSQDQIVQRDDYFEVPENQLENFVKENKYVLVYFRKLGTENLEKYDKIFDKILKRKSIEHYVICKVETQNLQLPNYRIYLAGFYRDSDFEPHPGRINSWSKMTLKRKKQVNKFSKTQRKRAKKLQSFVVFKYPDSDTEFELKLQELQKIFLDIIIYKDNEEMKLEFNDKPYQMLIIRKFGDGNKLYSSDTPLKSSLIQNEMLQHAYQHLQIMDERTIQKFANGDKIVIFFDEINKENEEKYSKMAAKYSGKVKAYLTDLSNPKLESFARFLDVSKEDFPQVRGVRFKFLEKKWTKFRAKENQSYEDFIKEFIFGQVKEFFKEEPVLEHEKDYQFKKVVRGNFNKIVYEKDKHVLIAFVTNWCEHCKEIKPAFDEIKTLLKNDVKDITFGIINVDKNDINMQFKNFPTIYFYKKNKKTEPINYDGMRDAEVILNFIEDQLDSRSIYNRKMPEGLKKQQEEFKEQMKQNQQQNEEPEYDL